MFLQMAFFHSFFYGWVVRTLALMDNILIFLFSWRLTTLPRQWQVQLHWTHSEELCAWGIMLGNCRLEILNTFIFEPVFWREHVLGASRPAPTWFCLSHLLPPSWDGFLATWCLGRPRPTLSRGSNWQDGLVGRKPPFCHRLLPGWGPGCGHLDGQCPHAPEDSGRGAALGALVHPLPGTAHCPRGYWVCPGRRLQSLRVGGRLWVGAEDLVGREDWFPHSAGTLRFQCALDLADYVAGPGFSVIISVLLTEYSGYTETSLD